MDNKNDIGQAKANQRMIGICLTDVVYYILLFSYERFTCHGTILILLHELFPS